MSDVAIPFHYVNTDGCGKYENQNKRLIWQVKYRGHLAIFGNIYYLMKVEEN